MKPRGPITVSDIIEEKPDDSAFLLTCSMYKNRMIALDGGTGKIIFDTAKNKKDFVRNYYPGIISAMWVEMREWKGHSPGFGPQTYEPVLMAFVEHNSWMRKIQDIEVTPEKIVALLEYERVSQVKSYNCLTDKQKADGWGLYHMQKAAIYEQALKIITDHYAKQEDENDNEKGSGEGP